MSVEVNPYMSARGRAPSDAAGYASQESQDSRSPLSPFNFLKNLNPDKKQTKADGQPQKRRGPKPDSKPALTRRQELNRQAQRTHRERKEHYIKALEQEVMRLKELFGNTARERDTQASENRKLRELLAANGIYFDPSTPSTAFTGMPGSYNGSTSGSVAGSYGQDSHTTGMSPPPLNGQHASGHRGQAQGSMRAPGPAQLPNSRLDFDQMGIDFVLTLERPCMEHMQYLVVRSHNAEGKPFSHPMERSDDLESEHMCGHALMASCPPMSHVMDKPGEPYPHQMPQLNKPDLMRLLEASSKLPGMESGELTPIRAWMMVLQHERVNSMSPHDFELVKTDLLGKVRCYGFGAVLEEFEVEDALNSLFAAKDSMPMAGNFIQQQQQIMA